MLFGFFVQRVLKRILYIGSLTKESLKESFSEGPGLQQSLVTPEFGYTRVWLHQSPSKNPLHRVLDQRALKGILHIGSLNKQVLQRILSSRVLHRIFESCCLGSFATV